MPTLLGMRSSSPMDSVLLSKNWAARNDSKANVDSKRLKTKRFVLRATGGQKPPAAADGGQKPPASASAKPEPMPGQAGPSPEPEPEPLPFNSSDKRNSARRLRGEAPAPRSTENGNAEDVAERKPPKLVEWRSPGNCAIEVDGELQVVSVAEAEKILAEGGSP